MQLEPACSNISIWLEGVSFRNTNSYICKVFLILMFSLSIANFHWWSLWRHCWKEKGLRCDSRGKEKVTCLLVLRDLSESLIKSNLAVIIESVLARNKSSHMKRFLYIYFLFGKSAFIVFYYCWQNTLSFRLCIVFLGFDVFFVVFCIALACIIGIAVCCCLPCIIALLYAVADQASHIHYLFLFEFLWEMNLFLKC